VRLKQARLARLQRQPAFSFVKLDIAEAERLAGLVAAAQDVDRIVHLAAQAGVRHSLEQPFAYIRSNVAGHLAVLETARRMPGLRHLVYASSSSVYGASRVLPFREDDRADTPLSLYAATKRSGELMSHAYAHLFRIPMTGLRFFTVYGPWGRPDMAYFSFAEAILRGTPITVYDGGAVRRDFTFIDDIVAGVLGCLDRPPEDWGTDPPARIFNIGNTRSEPVGELIRLLEAALGRTAEIRHAPRPAADVAETQADISGLQALAGFVPRTGLAEGVARFASWFVEWHASRGESIA
jgi:UDP-glucuronate 4-epimerase